MEFGFSQEQERWRREVRAFLVENATEELRAEVRRGDILKVNLGPEATKFRDRVVERGWFGLTWPREYGGLGKGAVDQLILLEEFDRAGVPNLSLSITSLGPTIIRFGTAENKRAWLPGILNGQIEMALGYSEPEAGSDLANLSTRAVLMEGEWVINGQKIWNSGAHACTHEWLAVRTDASVAKKHKGISVIVVPIDASGIEVQPLWTWGGVRTNQTFFTDVRVPEENLIGEVGDGWRYIMAALDFERVALGVYFAQIMPTFEALVAYCKGAVMDGQLLASQPAVRSKLAELDRDLEIARLLAYRTASMIDAGFVPDREASQQKVFTSELWASLGDVGTRLVGLRGQLNEDDPLCPLGGELERLYRRAPYMRFGGGTNEVQRNIIAQRGLGLPRQVPTI